MPYPRSALRSFLLVALAALVAVAPSRAQDVALGGTIQARLSYGRLDGNLEGAADDTEERLGFGIRRARLRATAQLTEQVGAYLQLGAAGSTAALLDGYAFYTTGPWRVQAGRFAVAQPRASQLTSHTRIDAIERAEIANAWEDLTLDNGGRDFGVEAQYEGEVVAFQAALHNGNGSWDRSVGNFRAGVDNPTSGAEPRGLAASFYSAYMPPTVDGLEVGGFVGINGGDNAAAAVDGGRLGGTPRSYFTYSAHAYWGARPGSQPVRVKGELIGIRYEELDAPEGPPLSERDEALRQQRFLGWALLGAARLTDASEAFARVEQLDPTRGLDDTARTYLTVGGSYSLSAQRGEAYRNQRVTLAYQTRRTDAESATPHLLVLQLQIVF